MVDKKVTITLTPRQAGQFVRWLEYQDVKAASGASEAAMAVWKQLKAHKYS